MSLNPKIISIKYPNGHYTTRVYLFKDARHYDNFYNKQVRLGNRVIGVEDE